METISMGQGIEVPISEFDFAFARSSGPGGQHVNRSETKVEMRWDIAQSPSLDDDQRALLKQRLGQYITDDGVLRLTSDESRSQHRNRETVLLRLQALAREALRPRRSRRPSSPSRSARANRLKRKKQHGQKKAWRSKVDPEEW